MKILWQYWLLSVCYPQSSVGLLVIYLHAVLKCACVTLLFGRVRVYFDVVEALIKIGDKTTNVQLLAWP